MLDEDQEETNSSQESVAGAEGAGSAEGASGEEEKEAHRPPNLTAAGTLNENLRWYVIHTYSGYEEKAKQALLQRAKEKNLADRLGDIHIPQTQKEMITKTGKKRTVSRTSFPGYMMAQLDLDDIMKVLVKDTPKITGFVGNSRFPKPLPDNEVKAMLEVAGGHQEVEAVAEPEVLYAKGDSIKVIDGPFSNFDGVIDEVRPDKARVRVLVSIFGRETPVELEFGQIEQV